MMEDPLSEGLLAQEFVEGDTVVAKVQAGNIVFGKLGEESEKETVEEKQQEEKQQKDEMEKTEEKEDKTE